MEKYLVFLFFLLTVTLTFGHEGHHNQTGSSQTNVTEIAAKQIEQKLEKETKNGTLEWEGTSNENPDYPVDDPDAAIFDQKDPPHELPKNGTNPVQASSNSEGTDDYPDESKLSEDSTNTESEEEDSTQKSSEGTTSPAVPSSSQGSTSSSSITTDDSENQTTNNDVTSPGVSSTSTTEKVKPSPSSIPITTQDYGDVSNNTTPEFWGQDGNEHKGLRTWSIVLFSVLISFCAIFTILYFIRAAIIRRRKEDQRRLLRASISSEGFFHGDGEGDGNFSGKFEL